MNRRDFLVAIAMTASGPAAAGLPADPVVLVHGLWMTGIESGLLRSRLREDYGFDPRQYSYRTVQAGLDANVRQLHEYLAAVPGDTLHVVGHSLGGLLALHTLLRYPDPRPGRVVCLGSPLRGSETARRVAALPWARPLLGRSAGLLQSGVAAWRGEAEVGVVAGIAPRGMGCLFAKFKERSDGTVALAETRLPWLADHVVLPCSHSGLVFSRAAARQAASFLRDGRFELA